MKSILLIDDDDSLRRVTEYNLSQSGYRVETASNGQNGLELFRRQRPAMVVTDVQMPDISGIEVLRAVKQERPETLVIVVTAFGTVEKAVEAMRLGAFDYLTKPFCRDALCLTVEKAFAYRDLREENVRLRLELAQQNSVQNLVGVSEEMQTILAQIRQVAPSDATVLIAGESGTGKELVARALHSGSERSENPFVPVNCAAIPKELLESELFGHVKGAFTGAIRERSGKFGQADGGTIFLDEVGEMPLELQPKLLRALQEREIEPVGGTLRRVDVRVIAASNKDLEAQVAANLFREDLYYRLAVIPLEMPPLRRRPGDIPLLARHFLDKHGGAGLSLDETALELLCNYSWPGNVRELENTIERCVVLHRGGSKLSSQDLPEKLRQAQSSESHKILRLPAEGFPLEELEKLAVLEALERNNWNQTRAAEFLRIPRHTLLYRMEKYALKKMLVD
ncbi:MAG TPA: sigma-54 dependent transcriptional regulator [Geothermobacteraceae bacterium]|nr:sigma-54 dependent transcriptional regulator [Geothermobacteraceae bacterium]